MLVLLAIMSPLTRCAEGAYGDFFDSATFKQAGFSGLEAHGHWRTSVLCHHHMSGQCTDKAVLDSRETHQTEHPQLCGRRMRKEAHAKMEQLSR